MYDYPTDVPEDILEAWEAAPETAILTDGDRYTLWEEGDEWPPGWWMTSPEAIEQRLREEVD